MLIKVVPSVIRVSKPELPYSVPGDASLPEVFSGSLSLSRSQCFVKKPCSYPVYILDLLPEFRPFLFARVVAFRQRDLRPVSQQLHRIGKVQPFCQGYEMDNVAALAAAEAVKYLFSGFDTERGSFFPVEGTEAEIILPLFLKPDIFRNDIDYIIA